jgi:sporulation protein YlmC with PRC-barrel domain
MGIQLNERIWTSDGQVAGTVDKVILDAEHGTVAKVVLRQGGILPHDVEVNLDDLQPDAEGRHRVAFDAAHLHHLPRFDEAAYTTPPPEITVPPDYEREQVLWPYGWLGSTGPVPLSPAGPERLPKEVVESLYEEDLQNAVIAAGSAIQSRDGVKVGELARLTFSESDGRLASLVVRQGFLFPHEHELPGTLVASAGDGVIYLNVDTAQVAALIAHNPPTPGSPPASS